MTERELKGIERLCRDRTLIEHDTYKDIDVRIINRFIELLNEIIFSKEN